MWANTDDPKSCFNCRFITECSHVKNVCFNVCYRVKNLRKGMFFFELAAKQCKSYIAKRKTKKRKSGTQLTLEFGKE